MTPHPRGRADRSARAHRGARVQAVASALALLLAALLPATPTRADETRIWIGVRTGVMFYNDTDPQPLEDLATELSDPPPGRAVDFDDKPWEIPIGLRFGARLNDNFSLYGMFERQPYLLEQTGDVPSFNDDTGNINTESIRLETPSNLWGGGIDFRWGGTGFSQSLVVGFAMGAFRVEGKDQDIYGIRNFDLDAKGAFYEINLAVEYEFSDELSIYPFGAYRYMKTSSGSATDVRRPYETDFPEFEIDFTGFTLGVEVRFRIFPWEESGPRPPEDFR